MGYVCIAWAFGFLVASSREMLDYLVACVNYKSVNHASDCNIGLDDVFDIYYHITSHRSVYFSYLAWAIDGIEVGLG